MLARTVFAALVTLGVIVSQAQAFGPSAQAPQQMAQLLTD